MANVSHYLNYFIGNISNVVLGLVSLFLLTTYLSVEDFGEYGFYLSIFSILVAIFNWGAKETVYKETVSFGIDRQGLFLAQVKKSILILLCSIPFIFVFPNFFIVIAFAIVTTVFQVVIFSNRGKGLLFSDAWALPMQRLVFVTFFLGLVFFNIQNVFFTFTTLIIATTLSILFFKTKESALTVSQEKDKTVLRLFLYIELISIVYLKYDILWGSYFFGYDAISVYFLSTQVFDAIILLQVPISYIFIKNYGVKLTEIAVVKFVAILTTITASGLIIHVLFIDFFLSYLPTSYSLLAQIITPLIFAAYFAIINSLLSAWLILQNEEVKYLKVCLIALCFSLVLTPLFSIYFSVIGMAYSKLLIEFIVFVCCFFLFKLRKAKDNY